METPGGMGFLGSFMKKKNILDAFLNECSLICFRNLAFVSLSPQDKISN
jgi:hypothetical protein